MSKPDITRALTERIIEPVAHTPTPWQTHDNIGRKGELGITSDAAPCIIAIMGNQKEWPVEAQANAAFIVQACNAHADLVAALEAIVARHEGLFDHPALLAYGPLRPNAVEDTLQIARAALAKVTP